MNNTKKKIILKKKPTLFEKKTDKVLKLFRKHTKNKKKWGLYIGDNRKRPNININKLTKSRYFRRLIMSKKTPKQIINLIVKKNNQIMKTPNKNDINMYDYQQKPDSHITRDNLIKKSKVKQFYLGLDLNFTWIKEICEDNNC